MMEGTFFIDALEGMSSEVIAQGLDEVSPNLRAAVGIDVLECCRESRNGKSLTDGEADDAAQSSLAVSYTHLTLPTIA